MQGAARVFAGELAHPKSTVVADGDGAAVLTPSGARCTRLFLVGACTEIRTQSGRIEARVADPTGAFLIAAYPDQAEVVDRLRSITPPAFVAVTCTVRARNASSQPPWSLVAESIAPATRALRDLWVLVTAEHTLARLEQEPRIASPECVSEIAAMVTSALETVQTGEKEGPAVAIDPRQVVMDLLAAGSGPRGMPVDGLVESARNQGLTEDAVHRIIDELRAEGDCYAPTSGYVKLL
jgi:RPA family protein